MLQRSDGSSGSMQLPKYQILMELGKGGMGQVHLAMSRGPRGFVKLVVLKSLKAELRGDEATSRLFHQEARISARLAHPNLVQTYEIIEEDGTPVMVLEYVEGQTLAAILEEPEQSLSRELHLTVLTKVLAGLHAAHELRDFDGIPLSLVHRDISPQNVMLQYDGQVRVLDFGIAKAARSNVTTETGILKGKIRYMAPEQLAGDSQDRRVGLDARESRLLPLDGELVNISEVRKAVPKTLIDLLSYDGHLYGVPSNIHRINSVFYNKRVLRDHA